jgi:integrase
LAVKERDLSVQGARRLLGDENPPFDAAGAPAGHGVRYRGPGQCRHTYASQMLTTGVASIDWIAEQMGHTNGNIIRQHYGTWINEDGPDVVGMLQLALKM